MQVLKVPSLLTSASIRDKVGSGRFYLSDNRHATVVKQPAHRPFAFSRKPFRLRAKRKGVVVIAVNACVFVD